MNLLHDKYPLFIDTDPRKLRTYPYPASKEVMQTRHDIIFQNINLQNKTVLDLGSCVGYTGAYVLDKGASFYQGIDRADQFNALANKNLSQYFDKSKWSIQDSTLEDFINSNTKKYDVVIALGIFYALDDPVYYIEKLMQISQCLIVESIHPPIQEEDVVLNHPIVYYERKQRMIYDNDYEIEFIGTRPSVGLFKLLFNSNGFSYRLDECELLEKNLNEYYNINRRFVIIGNKTQNLNSSVGLINSVKNNTFGTRKFTP